MAPPVVLSEFVKKCETYIADKQKDGGVLTKKDFEIITAELKGIDENNLGVKELGKKLKVIEGWDKFNSLNELNIN